jgi:hypothetical protein
VEQVTPEKLGRIRIDRVSLALYEDRKAKESQALVQLEGLALDGRRRVLDFIHETGQVLAEEDERKWQEGKPVGVSTPALPFALGLYDDRRLFLARSLKEGSKEAEHRKALELHRRLGGEGRPGPAGDLLSGYQPPWVQMALQKIPSDACALFLGEIPAEWRKRLSDVLGLRVCPRTFACHVRREGNGLALSLTLNLAKPGGEQTLREDLDVWRRQALEGLQFQFPALRREGKALASARQVLKTLRWERETTPNSGRIRTTVRISDSTRRALGKLVQCAIPASRER